MEKNETFDLNPDRKR